MRPTGGDQRQFVLREDAVTKGQYSKTSLQQSDYAEPTWFDIALKERAQARREADTVETKADAAKVEAEQPKRRLVRRSR
jgi:hypothetical protein